MKRYMIILVFFCAEYASAQSYRSRDIMAKADSILINAVGKDIFRTNFRYDKDTYYLYTGNKGHEDAETLNKHPLTKRDFKSVDVRYNFYLFVNIYHAKIMCSVYFDNNLNLMQPVNIDFIPPFLLNKQACNFIADTTALRIATKAFQQNIVKPMEVDLTYDYKNKSYQWRLTNVIKQGLDGYSYPYRVLERVYVDTMTAAIAKYEPEYYDGRIY